MVGVRVMKTKWLALLKTLWFRPLRCWSAAEPFRFKGVGTSAKGIPRKVAKEREHGSALPPGAAADNQRRGAAGISFIQLPSSSCLLLWIA